MIDTVKQFRKKYTLAIMIFIVGVVHSFLYGWSAGELTMFCSMILGIFGVADLVDKDKFRK